MDINQQIKDIVARRLQYLPVIDRELERVQSITEEIGNLDKLCKQINTELEDGKGSYFAILNENPKMLTSFQRINTKEVKDLLKYQTVLLQNLKKRFSRTTLSIALIGYERQGKSRFIQSITGLDNKVIPAYSGTSCTGAVSVIRNIEGPFHTDITYYTLEEFLDIVNKKIKSFFPERNIHITDPSQLKEVDLSGFTSTDADVISDYNKFIDSFVGHVDEYIGLLSNGTVPYTDVDEIARHVAQYENFDTPVKGSVKIETNDGKVVYRVYYHRYVAVKNVHIYKQFEMIDSKLIELVDTIGIGTDANKAEIEREMYRVLEEECDAAITVFKPDAMGGGFNGQQTNVLNEISTRLKDRNPDKWIAYVINKVSTGNGMNKENLPATLSAANDFIDKMQTKPIAWTKIIDGANHDEVLNQLVNPLLELISQNLPELDGMLMTKANDNGVKLRDAYFNLVNLVDGVLSGSVMRGASESKLFNHLYDKLGLSKALRELDEENYQVNSTKPCKTIEDALNAVVNNLYGALPKPERVEGMIDKGVKSPSEIYEQCCDEMLTNIAKRFDDISEYVITPLREKAKLDVASCLFGAGLLSRVPLKEYSVSDGPSMKWLRCLVDEKVKETEYPNLRKALLYVLDYDFTIKYTIEFDVSTSLGLIDKLNLAEFKPLQPIKAGTVKERAMAILTQLINKIPRLKVRLSEGNDRFALIPSHSFWAMVNKCRTELMRGEQTSKELRDFYLDHAWSIWKEDFCMIQDKEVAFGKWEEISDRLSELYSSNGFTISTGN